MIDQLVCRPESVFFHSGLQFSVFLQAGRPFFPFWPARDSEGTIATMRQSIFSFLFREAVHVEGIDDAEALGVAAEAAHAVEEGAQLEVGADG